MEQNLEEVQANTPLVRSFGLDLNDLSIFKLVIEKRNVFFVCPHSLWQCIADSLLVVQY